MKRNEALKFIKNKRICVLATADRKGKPEAATMAYVVDENNNFYFSTLRGSRKVQNLKNNGKVALVIGVSEGVPSVQIDGVSDFVSTQMGIDSVKELIKKKAPMYLRYAKMEDIVFFKVIPTEYWHNGERAN